MVSMRDYPSARLFYSCSSSWKYTNILCNYVSMVKVEAGDYHNITLSTNGDVLAWYYFNLRHCGIDVLTACIT